MLAHEAEHLAGRRNEAVAECYGLQDVAGVARRLGAPPGAAYALARLAYERQYPAMPDAYRSEACHPGGQLDRRSASGWLG